MYAAAILIRSISSHDIIISLSYYTCHKASLRKRGRQPTTPISDEGCHDRLTMYYHAVGLALRRRAGRLRRFHIQGDEEKRS